MKTNCPVLLLTALLVSVLCGGCASPAKPEAMVATGLSLRQKHSASTRVVVVGGNKTNPLWKSDVSGEDFATALIASIQQSGAFSAVIRDGAADYTLDVTLVKMIQPNFGLDLKVTAITEWRLKNNGTGKLAAEEFITREFTATVGDAFAAVKRLRLANEGAIRESIGEGLGRLGNLDLSKLAATP